MSVGDYSRLQHGKGAGALLADFNHVHALSHSVVCTPSRNAHVDMKLTATEDLETTPGSLTATTPGSLLHGLQNERSVSPNSSTSKFYRKRATRTSIFVRH